MNEKRGLELEYSAIREEIVSLLTTKDQLVGTMYTFCITIIGLCSVFNVEQVSGFVFVVLIPFQAFINAKQFHIARCGAYIYCFIETNIEGMQWEHIVHTADERFNKEYRLNVRSIQLARNLGNYGATIFAVAANVIYIGNNIFMRDNSIVFRDSSTIWIMLIYIMLGVFVFYLNRRGNNFKKIYEKYISIFSNMSKR